MRMIPNAWCGAASIDLINLMNEEESVFIQRELHPAMS